MTKTTKIILWVVVAIIVVGGIWYGVSKKPQAPVSKEPIKIGAILPLTGPIGNLGIAAKEGIDLALEDLNTTNIKVIYEDSKNDPKEGVTAFNKLTSVDKVDIIIVEGSSVSVPLVPLAEQSKTPLFTLLTYPKFTAGRPFVLRHFIQSDREAAVMAEYALNELNITKIGILYINDESGVGAKEAFKRVFEERGGKVIVSESYGGKDTDMRTQILKIKNQDVDGIYLVGYGPAWVQSLKQIKELGFKGKILTNMAMFLENYRKLAGESSEGVYFTYPYTDKSSKSYQDFISKYKAKYGKNPTEMEPYYTWDMIHIIEKALKQNNWQTKDLKNAIINIKVFDGAFGRTVINSDGDFLTPIEIGVIENGQIKEIKTIYP